VSERNDHWLIEDCQPIEALSAAASREKPNRKGRVSTLHWARLRRLGQLLELSMCLG
jgi:hypothetical protein